MLEPTDLLPFAIAAAILLVLRRVRPAAAEGVRRGLEWRRAPLVVGVVAFAFYWWYWGSLRQVPVVHDEVAYVLQSRIFASGRWGAPSPPLPEFFEQFHVLVVPKLAPKYPPGHALLMVPGVWLGLPGLAAVASCAATAGLLFALARRIAGPWVALLALAIWVAAPINLRFRPSYFSGITTSLLWLVGWWALLRWRDDSKLRWLALLSAAVAWGGITRPVTMIAFAIPTGIVVLAMLWRRRLWRQLPVALAAGLAICAIVPVWSWRVLGEPWPHPYARYTEQYLPVDRMGFGADTTAPTRALTPDMEDLRDYVWPLHAAHTPERLPAIAAERAARLVTDAWGAHGYLAIAAAVALTALSAEMALALSACAALLFLYLPYAHPVGWGLYYIEMQPVLALLAAVGLRRIARLGATALPRFRTAVGDLSAARPAFLATAAALLLLAAGSARAIVGRRASRDFERGYQRSFAAMLDRIPDDRAVVFIRYAPDHSPHLSLVANEPDAQRARVWTVYDRGADNERLMRLAPDRVAYLYDETPDDRGLRRRLRRLHDLAPVVSNRPDGE